MAKRLNGTEDNLTAKNLLADGEIIDTNREKAEALVE